MKWNIVNFDEVASTNTLAGEMLARKETHHGDVLIAKHQTSGRGRGAGRIWNDEPGASLLMSIVLTQIPEPAHLLQYRAALAVLRAIRGMSRKLHPDDIRLKWPNDILLCGKKVCGLLVEAQWNGPSMRSAIVGIGLNVKQQWFPPGLLNIATSLHQHGIEATIPEVCGRVLDAMEEEFDDSTPHEVLTQLRSELAWMSNLFPLDFSSPEIQTISGLQFEGLDDSGAVLLRREDGMIEAYLSGSLSWNK